MSESRRHREQHWLRRPVTIRWLWRGGVVLLALTVLAQAGVHVHAWFGIDAWFGFYAAFGFLSCVGMVLFAKVLGWMLKRPDSYYDRDD